MPSIITAGDASNGLVVASGNDGAVVIQSGLAGAKVDAVVAAADGTLTFLRAPIYSGSVLQVISATITDKLSTTSASYVDVTGLTVSITPSRSSNKILILGSVNYSVSSTTQNTFIRLVRNGLSIGNGADDICFGGRMGTTAGVQTGSINYYDSPATTSTVVYKFQFKNYQSSTSRINERGDTGNGYSSHITVMEIAG